MRLQVCKIMIKFMWFRALQGPAGAVLARTGGKKHGCNTGDGLVRGL
jgi:hypothetical protein